MEFALSPPIAFTKGMRRIQLADEVGGPVNKVPTSSPTRWFSVASFDSNLLQCGFKESSQSKKMASLRDVHGPKLSRPFVHVLENMPMDRL